MEGDHDGDGKLSFDEFAQMVANTVCCSSIPHGQSIGLYCLVPQDIVKQMTLEDLF
jgi:serine/threonine-protein phosphatase 2B regulatory subunit